MSPKDFFISYNKADRQWAEWIAWTLEDAGYSIVIQAWDFLVGENFVLEMQKATTETQRTIAVLSESYLKASFTHPEWAAAFVTDPQSERRQLIPVRVKECKPEGLLHGINYVDLVGFQEADAQKKLLESLKDRYKPDKKPDFPGVDQADKKPDCSGTDQSEMILATTRVITAPQHFPSALSRVQKLRETSLEQSLEQLMKVHNEIYKQLKYPMNPADRVGLETQLADIAEQMDAIALKLDNLGK